MSTKEKHSRERQVRTAEEFEQSDWVKRAKDPGAVEAAIRQAPNIIDRLGRNSKIGRQLSSAIELYRNNIGGQGLLSPRNLLLLGGAILYFVCPLDVIPDVIPVVGWLDDLGVLALVLRFILPSKSGGEEPEDVKETERLTVSPDVTDSIAESLPPVADIKEELEDVRSTLEAADENDVAELERELADPLRRIIFTGSFSAGKSSLINCLLDREFLPTSPLPCTQVLTTITYGEKPCATVLYNDDSVQVIDDLALLSKRECPELKNAKELLVMLPHELLRNGLSIVDTCGLDYKQFDERSYDELPQSSAFVFVKSLDSPDIDKAEDEFLNGAAHKLTGDQIIVALNKADLVDDSDDMLQEARERTQNYFKEKQFEGVRVYLTCAVNSSVCETEAFRRELRRRAVSSIPAASARKAQDALRGMKEMAEKQKARRDELAQLDAEEKERARELLERKHTRELTAIEKLADKAKERFAAHLRTFVNESLIPKANALIDKTPINEHFISTIMGAVRTALAQFIKTEINQIAQYFEQKIPETRIDVNTLISIDAPHLKTIDEATLDKIGSWLLPGTTLACFILMGPLSWLTSVALPLFVADRFKSGEALMEIFKRLGPTRQAREQFRQELASKLSELQQRICSDINANVIDDVVRRFKNVSLRETL